MAGDGRRRGRNVTRLVTGGRACPRCRQALPLIGVARWFCASCAVEWQALSVREERIRADGELTLGLEYLLAR